MSRSLSNVHAWESVLLKNENGVKKAEVSDIKIIGGKKHIFVRHTIGKDRYERPIYQTDEWVIPNE